jgi:hypothetical protein
LLAHEYVPLKIIAERGFAAVKVKQRSKKININTLTLDTLQLMIKSIFKSDRKRK